VNDAVLFAHTSCPSFPPSMECSLPCAACDSGSVAVFASVFYLPPPRALNYMINELYKKPTLLLTVRHALGWCARMVYQAQVRRGRTGLMITDHLMQQVGLAELRVPGRVSAGFLSMDHCCLFSDHVSPGHASTYPAGWP